MATLNVIRSPTLIPHQLHHSLLPLYRHRYILGYNQTCPVDIRVPKCLPTGHAQSFECAASSPSTQRSCLRWGQILKARLHTYSGAKRLRPSRHSPTGEAAGPPPEYCIRPTPSGRRRRTTAVNTTPDGTAVLASTLPKKALQGPRTASQTGTSLEECPIRVASLACVDGVGAGGAGWNADGLNPG